MGYEENSNSIGWILTCALFPPGKRQARFAHSSRSRDGLVNWFDGNYRQRLLSPSSGINVLIVLSVVLQILTTQRTAAPSIGTSANTTEEKRTVVKPPPTVSLARPVEITSRPEPIYTDKARASKTEGTVILQVTFYRDGRVIIEHIVQKLPNGLTNAAVKAARGIRFHPALDSDGQATDFTAHVRVEFLLAE